MSIRVKKVSNTRGTVLQVDGKLMSEDVGELARECRSVQGLLIFDLSNLQSADRAGVEILRELMALGAEVRGASPYVELLLKTTS